MALNATSGSGSSATGVSSLKENDASLTVLVIGLLALTAWRRAWLPALAVVFASLLWPHLPARRAAPFETRMLGVGDGMAVLVRTPVSANQNRDSPVRTRPSVVTSWRA